MSRRVSIGYQEFADIILNDLFYVDKTLFIKEWWEKRLCHIDYSSKAFWEDADNEYDREFFFYNT